MISGTSARLSAGIALQSSLSNDIATLQAQVSTGKRLGQPSDDPLASTQVAVIRAAQADDAAYKGNVDAAAATATRADSAMSSLSSSLDQALELVTQAANGANSAEGRTAAAAQLRSLAASITQLSQTKDSNGQPLFSDGPAMAIPIAQGVQVAPTVSKSALLSLPNQDGTGADIPAMLNAAADAIAGAGNTSAAAQPFLSAIKTASDQVATLHADQGVRAAQIDARGDAIATDKTDLATRRSGLEDTDLSAAISLITSKMTSLQAAQAVFAKVNSRTLFDAIG